MVYVLKNDPVVFHDLKNQNISDIPGKDKAIIAATMPLLPHDKSIVHRWITRPSIPIMI